MQGRWGGWETRSGVPIITCVQLRAIPKKAFGRARSWSIFEGLGNEGRGSLKVGAPYLYRARWALAEVRLPKSVHGSEEGTIGETNRMKKRTVLFSCVLASIAAASASAGFHGITADLTAVNGVVGNWDPPETWTARVYAELDAGDQLLDVFGTSDSPMYWAAQSQFYNHYAGGPTSLDIDPNTYPDHVDLPYDSWFTIGADSMYDNSLQIENVSFSAFNNGSALYVLDGGWSVSEASGQGAVEEGPDGTWRVLLAQLTVLGDFDVSILGSAGFSGVGADGNGWSVEGHEFTIGFVPAPSALAVLGLYGLASRRRRGE